MTFLELYNIYSSGNEAPRIFHLWSGLSAISACIGRQVWVTRGTVPPVYPNMYIILSSPPGTKKTTALSIAKKLVQSVKDIPVGATTITKEQIIVTMDTSGKNPDTLCKKTFKWKGQEIVYSHYSIFASEFINLINAGGNPVGMIDFFTNVWDESVLRDETKNKGSYMAENPFVSILGALTDNTIEKLNSEKVVSAGMLRRCLFVIGKDEGIDIPMPEMTQEQITARKELLERCHSLRFIQGEFIWEDEAKLFWDSLYRVCGATRRSEHSPLMREFYQTKPEYIIKVAMLLRLSDDPNSLIITAKNLALANELVTQVERGVDVLFGHAGRNPLSATSEAIANLINSANRPIHEKLIYSLYMRQLQAPEFENVMKGLVMAGRVQAMLLKHNEIQIKCYISPAFASDWAKRTASEKLEAGRQPLPRQS